MNKLLTGLAVLAVFSGCSILAPYTITFTTPHGAVVNPSINTIDLALNNPALAYISSVECGEDDKLELLPVVTEDMEATKVHNLTLEALAEQEVGAACTVTVTAFDQSTTANTRDSLLIYVLEAPVQAAEELTEEVTEEPVEETAEEEIIEEESAEEEPVTEEETAVEEMSEEEAPVAEEATPTTEESTPAEEVVEEKETPAADAE